MLKMIDKYWLCITLMVALNASCSDPYSDTVEEGEIELSNAQVISSKANSASKIIVPNPMEAKTDWNDTLEFLRQIEVPEYLDYQSEVEAYYHSYIGKACDKKTYDKNLEKNMKKLDSLINRYED